MGDETKRWQWKGGKGVRVVVTFGVAGVAIANLTVGGVGLVAAGVADLGTRKGRAELLAEEVLHALHSNHIIHLQQLMKTCSRGSRVSRGGLRTQKHPAPKVAVSVMPAELCGL
jgi:hypothetical protein